MMVGIVSKENIVVSGRYFAGLWKCWLYPIICLFLGLFISNLLLVVLFPLLAAGGFLASIWFLYADAANLRETHGLDKWSLGYIILFFFVPLLSVIIYYWTRNGLIQKAGMPQEILTWDDRILPYKNRNNIPSR